MNAKRLLNVFMVQARRVYPHHEFARKSNVCTLRVRLVNALCYLEERRGISVLDADMPAIGEASAEVKRSTVNWGEMPRTPEAKTERHAAAYGTGTDRLAELSRSHGVAPAIFTEIMAHYRPGGEARTSADLAAARAGYGEQVVAGYKAEAEKERLHAGTGICNDEFWGTSHCGQDAKEEEK